MPVAPTPIRLDEDLLSLLNEGARRTPHKKQELIRITLRRHLRKVIDQEAMASPKGRVTNVEPWPKGVIEAAYKRIAHENWDAVEEAVSRSKRPVSFDD